MKEKSKNVWRLLGKAIINTLQLAYCGHPSSQKNHMKIYSTDNLVILKY